MAVPPPRTENGVTVGTTTKKELVDRIADLTGMRRTDVRDIVQLFLDGMVEELADGNRLEFRDFGVFEVKHRAARIAQNPKTLEPVPVPERSAIRFKAGRLMKMAMEDPTAFEASFGDRRLSRAVPATAEVEVLGAAGRQAEVKPFASSKKKQVQPKSSG